MNIFQISQEILDIFQELEENGGELTEELEAQLAITQADFKSKVKSYIDVIKYNESNIGLIDQEIARLKELKDSKNKSIARLEKVIIWAVETFGETNKSGGKFVDYGTGKITVRNTQKVEVEEDFASARVNYFMEGIRELAFTKEIYYNELKDIIPKSKDIDGLSVNVSVDVPLTDIYNESGYNILKTLYQYNKAFKAKAAVSKTMLKDALKENPDAYPKLAHIITNKTLTIK